MIKAFEKVYGNQINKLSLLLGWESNDGAAEILWGMKKREFNVELKELEAMEAMLANVKHEQGQRSNKNQKRQELCEAKELCEQVLVGLSLFLQGIWKTICDHAWKSWGTYE